jgi:hypothetical protein
MIVVADHYAGRDNVDGAILTIQRVVFGDAYGQTGKLSAFGVLVEMLFSFKQLVPMNL